MHQGPYQQLWQLPVWKILLQEANAASLRFRRDAVVTTRGSGDFEYISRQAGKVQTRMTLFLRSLLEVVHHGNFIANG